MGVSGFLGSQNLAVEEDWSLHPFPGLGVSVTVPLSQENKWSFSTGKFQAKPHFKLKSESNSAWGPESVPPSRDSNCRVFHLEGWPGIFYTTYYFAMHLEGWDVLCNIFLVIEHKSLSRWHGISCPSWQWHRTGLGSLWSQFEPYRWHPCGVAWDSSRTVVVIKLLRTSALT